MSDELEKILSGNKTEGSDRKPIKKWAKLRLWLGYIYIALILVIAHPIIPLLYMGIYLIFIGIVIRLTASSELVKDRELCTTGIYGLTRNPLYLGSAVIGLGFAFLSASWWAFLYYFVVLAPAYLKMMRLEENYLEKLYHEEFTAYKHKVPAFFPKRLAWNDVSGRINTYRLMKSREPVSTAIFILLIIMVLAIHRTWIP